MPKRNPKRTFLIIALVLVIVLAALLCWAGLHILYAYLIAINVATMILYGYDKRQAIAAGGRVPELVLHLGALAGGSLGALLGMLLFRHKTKKLKFKAVFIATVILQAAAVYLYWRFVLKG